MKRLSLTLLLCLALSSCADRVRYNCDDLTNPNGNLERKCE
jgi:hypothetical protein